MVSLFWRSGEDTRSLVPRPFRTEDEFERTVMEMPEILGDIFLLKRQVRGGRKSGIPDIVGIDADGNVCIIEMKNVPVDASIIPQVLQYAFWAESNPDSIKSLWLECEDKPDDLSVNWEKYDVRILVVAPRVYLSTLDIVEKINYPVDLVEVNRWLEGSDELFLVGKLEPEPERERTRPVKGLETYDAEFYKKEFNRKSAEAFLKYVSEVKEKGWLLETKYNKHYVSFKSGFFNAFGISWVGSKTFAFFFKLTEGEAASIRPDMTRYETAWKQAVYYIDPDATRIEDYVPLMEASYERIAGT